jgi:hypothetical protein
MIRRTTWVLLAVFVVLLGVMIYLQRNPLSSSNNEEETPTPPVTLISLSQEEIDGLQIKNQHGELIAFVKNADGTWGLADPPAELGDDSVVQSMLSRLEDLTALSTLNGQVQDETLGLDPPQFEVTASTRAGNEQTLYIGIQTPTGSGYYLRVDDGPVYVVSKFAVDTLLTPLTDPTSIATATPENTPAETPAGTP